MKKNKKEISNIEPVVLNCFIRIIKDDGKYMLFRKGVNNTGIIKYLLKDKSSSCDSPFKSASCTDDIVNILVRITDEMAKSNGKRKGINELDKYEHVTMTINHLLHFFMESYGVSMNKLCSMGEKIYSLSCNKLFGDTIEDLEAQEQNGLNEMEDDGKLKAKLFHDYINGRNDGTIPSYVTFDEFVKKNKMLFDKINKNADDLGQGHMLGRPHENDAWL